MLKERALQVIGSTSLQAIHCTLTCNLSHMRCDLLTIPRVCSLSGQTRPRLITPPFVPTILEIYPVPKKTPTRLDVQQLTFQRQRTARTLHVDLGRQPCGNKT